MEDAIPNIKEIQDLKYFSWETYPSKKKQDWDDFLKRTKLDTLPGSITNIHDLNQKLKENKQVISDKQPRKHQRVTFWEYPSTVPPSIACRVAVERGCYLDDVNFLVHGSVLGFLARVKSKTKKEHVLVQRLGGGNIINIRIVINSHGNLVDAGRQFERLVRGEDIHSKPSLQLDQHLRTIELGSHKILVCAESDAMDANTGKQVEVKTKDPLTEKRFDRDTAKLLFQMISNGSDTLITADRVKNESKSQGQSESKNNKQVSSFTVESVKRIPISNIIEALTEGKITLDHKIATAESNLSIIQQKIVTGDETIYEMMFDNDQIKLYPFVLGDKEKTGNVKSQQDLCKITQEDFQRKNSHYYREHVVKKSSMVPNQRFSLRKKPNEEEKFQTETARVKEKFKADRGQNINDLLRKFKHELEKSPDKGITDDADRRELIKIMEADHSVETLDLSKLDRKNSALIATARLFVKHQPFDIKSVDLDMPVVVQDNLEQYLLPYLNAVELDGYQTKSTRKVFVIGNTGSGKTSFCKSLKEEKAILAKECGLEQTRYMQEFSVDHKFNFDSCKLEQVPYKLDENTTYNNVYVLKHHAQGSLSTVDERSVSQEDVADTTTPPKTPTTVDYKIHIYDCGGHNHYVLLNSLSFTRKSLFMITFKASDYHSQVESYHQLIGCHVETILGKDPEACILLAGSMWDKVGKNGLLSKNEEVDLLFKNFVTHVNDRAGNGEKSPKLIVFPDTKIFKLSNMSDNENGLSTSQKRLKDIIGSILMNDTAISIPASSPRFWGSFWEEIQNKKNQSYVNYKEAKNMFDNLVTGLHKQAHLEKLNDLPKKELDFIKLLARLISSFQEAQLLKKNAECHLSPSSHTDHDDSIGSVLSNPGNAIEIEPNGDSVVKSDTVTDSNVKDEESEDSESLHSDVEFLESDDRPEPPELSKNDDKSIWSFEAALRFLNETGEIIWFQKEFPDKIFHKKGVLCDTIKHLFDHRLEEKFKAFNLKENDIKFRKDEISQGIIYEQTYSSLFQEDFLRFAAEYELQNLPSQRDENESTHSSSGNTGVTKLEIIPKNVVTQLLLKLGVIIQTKIKERKWTKKKENKKVTHKRVYMVPSLINTPIIDYTKGKSKEEVFNQFQDEFQFTFVFGEKSCFASAGVIEAFLVAYYKREAEKHSKIFPTLKCYRENIESRIPGIVFCIEFFPRGEDGPKITIIEEERVNDEARGESYYKNRYIHVFMKTSSDGLSDLICIKIAMEDAIKSVITDKKLAFALDDNCGLRCLKCKYPEGYINVDFDNLQCGNKNKESRSLTSNSGAIDEDYSYPEPEWQCTLGKSHKLKWSEAMGEEFHRSKKLIIRRYASVPCLFYMLLRIIFASLDVVRDGFNAYGYFQKATNVSNSSMDNITTTMKWELGITWFLGIYTTVGMFIPALAYMMTFRHLLKGMRVKKEGKHNKWIQDIWIYRFYVWLSIPFAPVIAIISLFHSLVDKRMYQSAESVLLIEKSTENSWQFIVQMTALASGAIKEEDYLFEIEFFTGRAFKVPTSYVIWVSFIWSLVNTFWTLIKNKSMHQNRAEKCKTVRNLRKKKQRGNQNEECCSDFINTLSDTFASIWYTLNYVVAYMVKVLPSVMFRLLCFWLILSYTTEFYLNKQGNKPGWGMFLPAILILLVVVINFAVGYLPLFNLQLKIEELIANSFSNLILPIYVHLFHSEGEKYRVKERPAPVAEKTCHKELRKLDWYREPEDMENKFINKTIRVGNSFLLVILSIFVLLVNNSVMCPPPEFILNMDNHTMDSCKLKRDEIVNSIVEAFYNVTTSSKIVFGEDVRATTVPYENLYKNSYTFNVLMFSWIIPLGVTSILMSLSNIWADEVHGFVRKMIKKFSFIQPRNSQNRKSSLPTDALKALLVVLCMLVCMAYLTPVGLSIANWTTKCFTKPKVCFSGSILLIIMTISILFVGPESVFTLYSKNDPQTEQELQYDSGMTKKTFPECLMAVLLILVILVTNLVLILLMIFALLNPSVLTMSGATENFDECTDVVDALLYILLSYTFILILFVFQLLIYYAIQCRKTCKQRELRNDDSEVENGMPMLEKQQK